MGTLAEALARIRHVALGFERFRPQLLQRWRDGRAVGSDQDSTRKHPRSDRGSRAGNAPAEVSQSASCIGCACEAARGRALDAIGRFGTVKMTQLKSASQ